MGSLLPRLSQNRSAVWIATALIGVVLILLPFAFGLLGNAWVRALAFACLYVMLALGLNIVVGFAGLLDLGYIAFYAVGAYMYALLASPHLTSTFPWIAQMFPNGLHNSIWLVIPLGAGLAALFGIVARCPGAETAGRLSRDRDTRVRRNHIRIFLNNLNAPVARSCSTQG